MSDKLSNILNRRPSRWGNITLKEFERDIKLLRDTVREYQEENAQMSRLTQLLKQRDEMGGLISTEYDELYELLKEECEAVKDTLEFYENEGLN